MKKKVITNSIPLLSQKTGVGRYLLEISKNLQKEKNLKLYYYYGYFSKNLIDYSDNNIIKKSIKSVIDKNLFIKKVARKVLFSLSKFNKKQFDIYWEPNFIPIDSIKANKVVSSVHDFSFLLYKEFHPKERIDYFNKNFFKNIIRSDYIICFSKFTKSEILERIDIESKRVKVIYHGVDYNLFKVYSDLSLLFSLPKKFILCVGSIEPRKNLLGLLKAYAKLDKKIKDEYKIVLVGFKGWNNKEIVEIIKNNRENILYLGYISDIELAKVYNLATLFVYPSFYEGFGLPILEAMACGVPVVTSNISSMPEVGGDAVVYCNPHDIENIKAKIEMVLSDEKLQQEMIQKGLKRAKEFTWEKSANEHLKLFKEALEC